ncbi:MAG: putative collagen-binding protein [Actinomycetia bacterium]|nr:putative collagen-binding protein [Actinomycetes bacterium]
MRSLSSGNTTKRIAAIAAAAIPVLAVAAPAFAATPAPAPAVAKAQAGTIQGVMWQDSNGNGIRDTNEKGGVAGVKLILSANDGSGNALKTTYTDRSGAYRFTGVPLTGGGYGMLYSIVAGAPTGWQWTKYIPGHEQQHSSEVDTLVTLPASAHKGFPAGTPIGLIDRIASDNLGEQHIGGLVPTTKPATPGKITGTLFRDTNRDGIHQASEPALRGAEVLLLRADTDYGYHRAARTVTDIHGRYAFTGLATTKPGIWAYMVAASSPIPGATFEPLKDGLEPYNAAKDYMKPKLSTFFPAHAVIGVDAYGIHISAGQSMTFNGAVVTRRKPAPAPAKTGTITGRIWADANHNGRQDKGEPGVKGATALLIHNTAGGKHEYLWRTTGADGLYTFAKLAPAVTDHSYTLIAGSPAGGWKLTKTAPNGKVLGSTLVPYTGHLDPDLARHFARDAALGTFLAADAHAGQTIRIDGGFVPPAGDPNTLPTTGASVQWLAAGGSMVAAGGLALVLLGRRRTL